MATLTITLHENLSPKQRAVFRSKSPYILLKGPAGTSKTYNALARGLKLLSKGDVEKIIIIRSAVEIRKIGFLPGDQQEKLDAYAGPYIHLFNQLSPKKNYRALVADKKVEFHSTSYLRGMTFDNACIIVDEYQNMSEHELETIATRVGQDTHLILCGDTDQSDLPKWEQDGHQKVIDILEAMDEFDVIEFGIEDIKRGPFVKKYYETKKGRLPEFVTRQAE